MIKHIKWLLPLLLFVSCNKILKKGDDVVEEIATHQTRKRVVKNLPIHVELDRWAKQFKGKVIKKGRSYHIKSADDIFLGKVYKSKNRTVITTFPLIEKKVVNPLLNGKLLPNAMYKVEHNVFVTDKYRRVLKAYTDVIPKNKIQRESLRNISDKSLSKTQGRIKGSIKNNKATPINLQKYVAEKQGRKGVDHGGHLIAHSLGGNSGAINIVPQLGKLNQGAYASIERFVRTQRKHIKHYEVDLVYKGRKKRPSSFVQSFDFYGSQKEMEKLAKRNPALKFKKVRSGVRSCYRAIIFHSNG